MICTNPRKTPLAHSPSSSPAHSVTPTVPHVRLGFSALEAAQAPQHLRNPNAFRLSPPSALAIPFVQHLCCRGQDLARDAVRGVRVLGQFVDSVCEGVDGWFESGGDGADTGRWC